MKFKFGTLSLANLSTCHDDLQLIAHAALAASDVDFGISEGHRSIERQNQLFKEGKSKIDGVTKKGKHNEFPSHAFDIYAAVPGKKQYAFDANYLAYLGGVITSTANILYQQGQITHLVRWGYNWDMDGEIGTDQTFQDMPHFEIYKPD